MNKPLQPQSRQLEIQWHEPESFTLTTEQSTDGERLAKEAAQLAADQQASQSRQTEF